MIPSSRLKIHGVPNEHGEVVVYDDTRDGSVNHAQHAIDLPNTICRWSSSNALPQHRRRTTNSTFGPRHGGQPNGV